MATKKKPVSKMPTVSSTEPDMVARSKTKPVLTRAADTVKAIRAMVESKPVGQTLETGTALVKTPKEPSSATQGARAPLAPKIVEGPVQYAVTRVFEGDPDKEFTVNAVIAELKKADPGINENSIRFTVTELKRKSVIHHIRNEGHYQILKFSKPGEAKPFPNPALVVKPATKSAVKGSPADLASDLAVLREATLVIAKLEKLVHRNQDILTQIKKLRSIL
jgi:hypothetical protein